MAFPKQWVWSSDCPLGKRTIMYGHNGSGKSTVSELLLSLAAGECAVDLIWEDEAEHRTTVRAGGTSPSPHVADYTRKWVEENLAAFPAHHRDIGVVAT